jgi:hypothetical protein
MTSYEFEKAAKNAVIQTLSEDISIDQLDLVWFAHELGYKKCTICQWVTDMQKLLITEIKMRYM